MLDAHAQHGLFCVTANHCGSEHGAQGLMERSIGVAPSALLPESAGAFSSRCFQIRAVAQNPIPTNLMKHRPFRLFEVRCRAQVPGPLRPLPGDSRHGLPPGPCGIAWGVFSATMDKYHALYYSECKFAGFGRNRLGVNRRQCGGSGDLCPNPAVTGNHRLRFLNQQVWIRL